MNRRKKFEMEEGAKRKSEKKKKKQEDQSKIQMRNNKNSSEKCFRIQQQEDLENSKDEVNSLTSFIVSDQLSYSIGMSEKEQEETELKIS